MINPLAYVIFMAIVGIPMIILIVAAFFLIRKILGGGGGGLSLPFFSKRNRQYEEVLAMSMNPRQMIGMELSGQVPSDMYQAMLMQRAVQQAPQVMSSPIYQLSIPERRPEVLMAAVAYSPQALNQLAMRLMLNGIIVGRRKNIVYVLRRDDMPLLNPIPFILYRYFKEHGLKLGQTL